MSNLEFTVTEQHVRLLRAMYVGWNDCEFGAPEIDPKRPYGNSSVYHDIAEILGIDPEGGTPDDREYTDEQKDHMRTLHEQTQTVLQITLSSGVLAAGLYRRDYQYSTAWRKVR